MPAPTYHSVTSGENEGASFNVSKPSGAVEGDVLVAHINVGDVAADAPTATGWTVRATPIGAGDEWFQLYTFTRTVGAGDGSSYAFSLSASAYVTWYCTRWSGVDTANPIDAYTTNYGYANPRTGLGLTTLGADRQLLLFTGAFDNPISAPSGMTARATLYGGISGVYSQEIAAAGATGNRAASMPAGNDFWAAQMVALAPAAGAAATPRFHAQIIG